MGGGTVKTPEQIAANVVVGICQAITLLVGGVGIYGVLVERLEPLALLFAVSITITAVRAILKEQDDANT